MSHIGQLLRRALSSTEGIVLLMMLGVAVMLLGVVACESPTTITNDNDNDNNLNAPPPIECGVLTEEINGVCEPKTCDEGFELDDEGESVESVDEA